ncbi:4-hydroxy-tetrahydrodipicolinate synthase, partial [Streptomyces hundungensis]|uniref:4-hydroxy-tetrahydrodipicolinate synthase n=1 Tax=Streptomyces hundungensis TaxID=1077946 RepID=UPI0033FD42AB
QHTDVDPAAFQLLEDRGQRRALQELHGGHVGDRAHVVAGIGTNDTRHTLELARTAERSGAHGLLAVTPYYNKPPQEGLFRHFSAIADATELPVMLYDIPGRSGVPIDTETLVRLAEHPRIVANKDAKGDLGRASWAIARSGLAWYSGDDMLNLPLLSVGACGFVSVVGHLVTPELRALLDAHLAGDVRKATEIHQQLLPVYTGMFRTQGVITTKAALALQGLPAGPLRLPMVELTPEESSQLALDLAAGGVQL